MYWDDINMMEALLSALQAADRHHTQQGTITGILLKAEFLQVLSQYFSLKTRVRFNQIKRVLNKEPASKGTQVRYIELFSSNRDGDQGPFAELIRRQYSDERAEYLEDLDEALTQLAAPADTTG